MANIRKKTIQLWDGGVKTSSRSSNPDTSDGAQVIKGFDIYKDPKKLIPMQSWESFTTDAEKALNIRAMGGISETVYGVGSALDNWYGLGWSKRIRVDINAGYLIGAVSPLHLDMSLLPNDFWSNVQSDMADVRVTDKDNTPKAVHTENVDTVAKTGDMWIDPTVANRGTAPFTYQIEQSGTGSTLSQQNASNNRYAFSWSVQIDDTINYFKTKLARVAYPSDITVALYTDNAGVPGTLVQNLGTITSEYITTITTGSDCEFIFDPITPTPGTYHIVVYAATASVTNQVLVVYRSTGTSTINTATNAGLTTWTSVGTSLTPNFKLGYMDYDQPYFYIYYGNPNTDEINYGSPIFQIDGSGRDVFTYNNTRFAYTFGDERPGNNYYSLGVVNSNEAFTTDPSTYTTGLVGSAIQTLGTLIQTNNDDSVGLSGNGISLSCMFYYEIAGSQFTFQNGNVRWAIAFNGTTLSFYVDGENGNATNNSTFTFAPKHWYIIDVVYDNDYYIYVNGKEEKFTDNNGDYDERSIDDTVRITTTSTLKFALPMGYNNNVLTESSARTKVYNFTQSDFYTIGSEEDITDITLQYDGVQLYQKTIPNGTWEDVLIYGRPVKGTYYPVNGFVDDTGTYFMVSSDPENEGSLWIAKKDNEEALDQGFLPLGVMNGNTIIQSESAIDGSSYFNTGGSTVGKVGDPGDDNVFSVPSTVQTLSAWRTYLAVGYTYRNFGYIQTWDLTPDTQAVEKINTGTGNMRILGNAQDILFSVQDNFIDDAVKSANKPTMEIKQYVGNGSMETTHTIEIPAVITSYDDVWERAVSAFKIKRNTQTLFYARLPSNEAGTTFNEGFWSVGKNSRGQLSLALQVDTEGLGMPENVFGFAQQMFFIAKDGGIFRLSDDTYNNTALFTTLKMNEGNTDVEKKLIGVEVVTEPLEAGQTISVYYKKNGDTERTKIFDMTGEGEISYEQSYDINENNLPHYKEIEFDIESTGGKSGILELNYKYEYLSSVV